VAKSFTSEAAWPSPRPASRSTAGWYHWENEAHVFLRRPLGPADARDERRSSPTSCPRGALMDFNDSQEEAEFRSELRSWLALNAVVDRKATTDDERRNQMNEWHRLLYSGGGWG